MAEDAAGRKDSECVKVVVRCRPRNKKEVAEGRQSVVKLNTDTGYVELANPKQPEQFKGFTFDAVYDEDSTQRMVYDETAFPLVESVLEGFNGTIFAYGQTGCGKTWTMTGMEDPEEATLPKAERGMLRGIIPNSFEHIFNTIKLKHASASDGEDAVPGSSGQIEFLVRASYLEIYNEEIRDLMSSDSKKKLQLKESPDKGVYVKDLMYEVVESRSQIDAVLARGTANRTVGQTLMNSASSRSHSIFGIVIEVNEIDASGENHIRMGKLNLVDLAGSERQSKTGASGSRLKEGCKINLSLSALGNVISALVDGKGKHIPYRDSKLTRLLQDSLGGNTKTVMISAISPADYNYEETLSTLRYANRAKNVKNKPVINEDAKDCLLREYKEQIEELKRMLAQQQIGGVLPLTSGTSTAEATNTKARNAEQQESQPVVPGVVMEKVVQVEKVVEKVVPDKNVEAENRALQDYSDAVVEQRNRLGEELDRKEEEIERQRQERQKLEEKLRRLQGHVLGQDKTVKEDEKRREKVIEARKQREIRKAQIKLKQQQRKEAELQLAKERAEEEKKLIEEECKNAQGVAEAKQKALKALKKTMIAKMDKVKSEMRDLEQEFQEERESLLETIREQTREIKRLDQVVDMFLPTTERTKLWELSTWQEDDGEWKLPKLRPRKDCKPLRLPGLGGAGANSGADAGGSEGGMEVVGSTGSPVKRSKRKEAKKRRGSNSSVLSVVSSTSSAGLPSPEPGQFDVSPAVRDYWKVTHSPDEEDRNSEADEDEMRRRREQRRQRKSKKKKSRSEAQHDGTKHQVQDADPMHEVEEKKQDQDQDQEDSQDSHQQQQNDKRRRSRRKRASSSGAGGAPPMPKGPTSASTVMAPSISGGSVQWPTGDLPSEHGALNSSAYGDRCQSRQGRRNSSGATHDTTIYAPTMDISETVPPLR